MMICGCYRKRRMQLPASDPAFTPEMCFEPITILIDEVPEVVSELAGNKDYKSLWSETVKIFGSGGAKVNMNVLLLSQSPNIEDVGMNAKMRENFTTIALANMAKPFIDNYERDKSRREELAAALVAAGKLGMKPAMLPAAAEYGGDVQVLSRDGILEYRETSINANVWRPSADEDPPEQTEWALPDGRTTDGRVELDKVEILAAYRRAGTSRDDARAKLASHGIQFENADWTEAGRQIGNGTH
jgi:hypothetical protein